MGKLDEAQTEAVMRAAREAGIYQREVMTETVDEIRRWLTSEGEGGMTNVSFDREDFIAAGLRVQDRYAAQKGKDFNDLLAFIRSAAR